MRVFKTQHCDYTDSKYIDMIQKHIMLNVRV